MRGRKRSSFVWKYFEQRGNTVRCLVCQATFKYVDGTTTVMMGHIRRVHPVNGTQGVQPRAAAVSNAMQKPRVVTVAHAAQDIRPCVVAVEDVKPLILDEDAADAVRFSGSAAASTSSSTPEHEELDRRRTKRSTVWDVFVRLAGDVQCTMCDVKLKFCSSTSNMMYHLKTKHPGAVSETEPSGTLITTALIRKMIERDLLPVSTVDGRGFRALLAHLAPNYKVPFSEDMSQLVEGRMHEMTEALAIQLSNVEKVALTADVWSSTHPGQRYLTICCSFITEDWCQRSVVLQTHQLPSDGRATPGDAVERLLATMQAWGLAGKVTTCVRNNDNGWDTPPCDTIPPYYLHCFASTLQLAVQDGLDGGDLLPNVVAAGRLARHFNSNMAARDALEQMQLQMCLPQRRLIRSSRAKWHTVCDMFECLLEQRWAIKAVLSDRTVTSQCVAQALELEDECWQTMENLAPVLSTLRWATKVISDDTEVSISNVYPITFSLIQTHLVPKECDVEQVAEFKRRVQAVLRRNMEVGASSSWVLPFRPH